MAFFGRSGTHRADDQPVSDDFANGKSACGTTAVTMSHSQPRASEGLHTLQNCRKLEDRYCSLLYIEWRAIQNKTANSYVIEIAI